MRFPRPRFRPRTALMLVAVMAVLIASGISPERVGAIYDATSMPGYPVREAPIYRKGWFIRLAEPLRPAWLPSRNPSTRTTHKRTSR